MLVSDDGITQTHNLLGLSLIQQDDGSQTRTLLADGLGSVRVEMVGSAIDSATTYEPYGKLLARSGDSGTVYGYTGEQHDAATGLVYLRARYYNPTLHMFMGKDPWRGSIWRPATLNGYDYAGGNPVNFIDPGGNCYGPAQFLRQIEPMNCANMDMAFNIMNHPDATGAQKAGAFAYATTLTFGHLTLGAGAAMSGGFGQGLVAYTAGYGGYDLLREGNNSSWVTVPGYILGYENIHRDLITLNDPCASPAQKILAAGDATLNTVLGATGFSGAAQGARSIKTAWQLRNLSPAARFTYLQNIAARTGVEVVESSRFYRPLHHRVIEVPANALDDAWRLSGGFYHELAHVGQEFGRVSTLKGGSVATNVPKGLQWLSTKLERGVGTLLYPLNPVEAHAFVSGSAHYSQNALYLVYNRLALYLLNQLSGSSDDN